MGLEDAKAAVNSELCDVGCSVLDRNSLGGDAGLEVDFDSMMTDKEWLVGRCGCRPVSGGIARSAEGGAVRPKDELARAAS